MHPEIGDRFRRTSLPDVVYRVLSVESPGVVVATAIEPWPWIGMPPERFDVRGPLWESVASAMPTKP